ncbi:MAG: hypothetical protein JXA41_03620 [Deltaproteobacteria bacterium]|nr:hypothetical protein [Deltaproteobacteria bacterium]
MKHDRNGKKVDRHPLDREKGRFRVPGGKIHECNKAPISIHQAQYHKRRVQGPSAALKIDKAADKKADQTAQKRNKRGKIHQLNAPDGIPKGSLKFPAHIIISDHSPDGQFNTTSTYNRYNLGKFQPDGHLNPTRKSADKNFCQLPVDFPGFWGVACLRVRRGTPDQALI